MPVHVRTGDTVMVTAGNDKGAVGEILSRHYKEGSCCCEGREHPYAEHQANTTKS